MLPPTWKKAIIVLYSLLLTNVVVVYVAGVIIYEKTWACAACRNGEEPSPIPLLVYFSVWNVWFAIAVFVSWILLEKHTVNQEGESSSTCDAIEQGENNGAAIVPTATRRKNVVLYLFSVALPLAMTTSVTYTYYITTNPVSEFVNEDLCYTVWRSFVPYDMEKWIADLYMAGAVISDWTMHYFCTILMLILYFSGELPYAVAIPWSTIFSLFLGIIIAIVQMNGITVYCGDNIWVSVGGIWIFTLFFHVTFYLGASKRRQVCGCCIHDAQTEARANIVNKNSNGTTTKEGSEYHDCAETSGDLRAFDA